MLIGNIVYKLAECQVTSMSSCNEVKDALIKFVSTTTIFS